MIQQLNVLEGIERRADIEGQQHGGYFGIGCDQQVVHDSLVIAVSLSGEHDMQTA